MTTYPVTAGGAVTASDATVAAGSGPAGAAATDSTTAGPVVKSSTVDRVTLQGKSWAVSTVSPEKGNNTIVGRIGSVLFSYNSRGALRIKFMDSTNTLVYQTPPVLMSRMMDLMRRPDYAVSARV
jgi:hypothetical protein